MRRPLLSYVDPLDGVWLAAANALGLRIVRDSAVYASYDGRGTLSLAPDADLDPDDCLAQMILHELCHALVQGEASWNQLDWGLFETQTFDEAPDFSREYACLRLQAALLRPHGLDRFLAPTTDFRIYYDALPVFPIEGSDPSVPLAQAGLGLAYTPRYRRILQQALTQTARLYAVVQSCHEENMFPTGTLWQTQDGTTAHPAGFPMHPEPGQNTCGTCAWYDGGVCQQQASFFSASKEARLVTSNTPACVLHETVSDCQTCAACCRHGYDVVPVTRQDLVPLRTKPELIENKNGFLHLRRIGNPSSCAALETSHSVTTDRSTLFLCRIYEDRPAACGDLARGSAACLTARKRVGLSL